MTVDATPQDQELAFRKLRRIGIQDVVLVGRPYSAPPAGAEYRSTVEHGLVYLRNQLSDCAFNLGVIEIHTRAGEVDRIIGKFRAAGGRLRVMGHFLDEVDSLTSFMDRLAHAFEANDLDLGRLEWNVGLTIFALKTRGSRAEPASLYLTPYILRVIGGITPGLE